MIGADPLPPDPGSGFAGRRLNRASAFLATAGGAMMLALSFAITASVLMRWLLGEGVPGDFDLVQVAAPLAAFAFLPFCQARRGNVVVDSFTAWLSPRSRALLDSMWDLVWAGFAGVIAWRLAVGAQDALSSQTTSMVIGIPLVYPVAACAVMAAFLALLAAATAIRSLQGRS